MKRLGAKMLAMLIVFAILYGIGWMLFPDKMSISLASDKPETRIVVYVDDNYDPGRGFQGSPASEEDKWVQIVGNLTCKWEDNGNGSGHCEEEPYRYLHTVERGDVFWNGPKGPESNGWAVLLAREPVN